MSSPREAVYDVLLSKARRAREAIPQQLKEAWARYEEQNERAHALYRGDRRHGSQPEAKQ